jgi:hypothetical protein
MKPPLFTVLALAVLLLASCSKSGAPGPSIISAPGSYSYFRGAITVTVTAATNGAVNFRFKHGESEAAPPRSPLRAGQPWFISVTSPTNAWVFDGRKDLYEYEFRATGIKSRSSQRVPELIRSAPQSVRDRLPAELKGS